MSWYYEGKGLVSPPENAIGFIYRIDNLSKNKFYIGKKEFQHKTNPEISKKKYESLKKEGVAVTKTKNKNLSTKDKIVWRYKRKNHIVGSDWETYCGSNDVLKADVANGDKIKKTILKFCYSKQELTLKEVEELFKEQVLYLCNSYNANILGKFFKQKKCE